MCDTANIQKLNRCLLYGKPILFTGAGFSLGATNNRGEKIPSGNELKKAIITDFIGIQESDKDYEELNRSSLSDICDFAESNSSALALNDFIIERLSKFKPTFFQEIILSFDKWQKVYTINIDDVVENSDVGDKFLVQNTERKRMFSQADYIEYIKLHGCIRNTSGKIVFSKQQYVDSMLHSTDYRFNCFAQDIQTQNFVIVGTELDEIDLDYYITLFSSVAGKTIHGQLYFINPKPGLIFESKMKKIGAVIIKWTAEEFANHIKELGNSEPIKDIEIKGLLNVRSKYEQDKIFKGYKSDLYFGQYPIYKDIVFDWDFINPSITDLTDTLIDFSSKNNAKLMVALYGKSLVGKTIYLKRIALSLIKENFSVYEFCGKDFDVNYFIKQIKKDSEHNVALIIDNASFYYSEICYMMKRFPIEKNIFVLTASRAYSHFRKRYCLVSEPWYQERYITGETNDDSSFSENIAKRLDEKGLLGSLKAMTFDERVSQINRYNDVSSFLYSITNGQYYQKRQLKEYFDQDFTNTKERDFLIQLSIFHKLDLPYFPCELFNLIYGEKSEEILEVLDNYITYFHDFNGYAIRNSFLVPHILKNVSTKKKIKLIKEVLIYVSPQVVDSFHSYWNEVASTLMKCRLLNRILKLNNVTINELLSSIKAYYNDDYNYWLQVGLTEQFNHEFDHALNHFQQAESLSPTSYLVKNAIARNFLRQANEENLSEKAEKLFEEGVIRMKNLIREREEFQVRAYSTHCLLFEEIRYFRKNNFIPDRTLLSEMYDMLKSVIDKSPDDPMSNHISNVFYKFIVDNQLQSSIPSMKWQDLALVKTMMTGTEMLEEDVLENFELE